MSVNVFKKNHLFVITYLLMVLEGITEQSELVNQVNYLPSICQITEILVCCMFALHFVMTVKFSLKQFVCIMIVVAFLILSANASGQYVFLKAFLCIIAAANLNVKSNLNRMLAMDCVIRILMVSFIVYLSLRGFLTQSILEGRMSYGFSHPNGLGLHLLAVYLEITYLVFRKRKNKFWNKLFIVLSVFVIYILANAKISRSMVVCMTIATVLMVLAEINPKTVCNRAVALTAVIVALFSITMSMVYKPNIEWMQSLNEIMSNRLLLSNMYYKTYGLSLLGQHTDNEYIYRIAHVGTGTFDNAYMNLAVRHGIIILILFIIFYTKILAKCVKDQNSILLICCLTFIVYGVSEFYVCAISVNFTLLFFSQVLWKGRFLRQRNHT